MDRHPQACSHHRMAGASRKTPFSSVSSHWSFPALHSSERCVHSERTETCQAWCSGWLLLVQTGNEKVDFNYIAKWLSWLSLYEPLGPITFGKSRRTTQLNHCISIQDIWALNCTLAGSAGTLYRLHGIFIDRKLSYCCFKPLSSFDRNQSCSVALCDRT